MSLRTKCSTPRPLLKAVHALLLLGWLLSSQGVGPSLCAMAAALDGRHRLEINTSEQGSVQVVLSHGQGGAGTSNWEHPTHGMLCKVIMVFAQARTQDSPVHVLSFQKVDETSRAQEAASRVALAKLPLLLAVLWSPFPTGDHVTGGLMARLKMEARTSLTGLDLRRCKTVMRC